LLLHVSIKSIKSSALPLPIISLAAHAAQSALQHVLTLACPVPLERYSSASRGTGHAEIAITGLFPAH